MRIDEQRIQGKVETEDVEEKQGGGADRVEEKKKRKKGKGRTSDEARGKREKRRGEKMRVRS